MVPIDGKVDCSQMKTGATRPCEDFTPPPKVAVGETFSADGKTRQIGVIRAAQVKGNWICVAAETPEDIPVDKSRDRTWLAILKCKPDLGRNILRHQNDTALDANGFAKSRPRADSRSSEFLFGDFLFDVQLDSFDLDNHNKNLPLHS